jgi:hypothetical protein
MSSQLVGGALRRPTQVACVSMHGMLCRAHRGPTRASHTPAPHQGQPPLRAHAMPGTWFGQHVLASAVAQA